MLQLDASLTVKPCPIPLLQHTDTPHPERGVAQGLLVRVRHGVYASTALWKALAPWDRYLARVHAVALVHPDAVFCCESAAALLGMPVFGDPGTVHVFVEARDTSRSVAGIHTHRASRDRTIIVLGGIAMTSPADTAVDLARHRHNALGLAAADAAMRLDPALTRDALVALNEARVSSRGRNVARWPLPRATSLAETALESISRATIEWLGFPAPELQRKFQSATGEVDRSDFHWHDGSLAGEADGDLKYDGRFGDPVTILRLQSARDSRLREHVRSVAHWGWVETVTVAPLRGILSGAGLRAEAPEYPAQLHALTRLLASRAPHPVASAQRPSPAARVQPADER